MRIKLLLLFSPFIITSSIAQKTTMLKDSVVTEKRDSSAVFTFSSSERRRYWTSDFLMGKKAQGVSLSPNGRFALINYNYVYKDGSVGNCCELTDRSGKIT